jgi:hypothetical protein
MKETEAGRASDDETKGKKRTRKARERAKERERERKKVCERKEG